MIVRARAAITMCGAPIEDAAVAVADGTITAAGPWDKLRSDKAGEVVDLGDHVLLPGLINAHCHLDYTGMRGSIPPPSSFAEWVRAINERKAVLQAEDYLRAIADGFAEAAAFGTTTLCNLEAFPELLVQIPRPRLRTWWFAEMLDVRGRVDAGELHARIAAVFAEREGWLGGIGLAPHAPFTASAELYADAAAVAREHQLPLTTHLAESHEEMEMFANAKGSLFEFLRSIGRPTGDCGGATPLAVFLATGVFDERWIVAHLNELTVDDLQLLGTGPKFHVVHCPRSHAYFRHSPFKMHELRALGFNICVGTDSLASNSDLSLFAELRQLRRDNASLRAVDLLEMVTINPARALNEEDSLGCLAPGFHADLIAIPVTTTPGELLDAVIDFEGAVPWTMVAGEELTR